MPSHKRGVLPGKKIKTAFKILNKHGTGFVNTTIPYVFPHIPSNLVTTPAKSKTLVPQSHNIASLLHVLETDSLALDTSTAPDTSLSRTSYFQRQQRKAERWSQLRPAVIDNLLKRNYPSSFSCFSCGTIPENLAIIRCQECGPCNYYCSLCCQQSHLTNLHSLEKWNEQEQVFERYMLFTTMKRPNGHSCSSSLESTIVVIDDKGYQHLQTLQFCKCEERAATLVSYGLWPASPTIPSVAFTFDLMLTARALILEGQISLSSFCHAMQWRRQDTKEYEWVKDISRVLRWETLLHFMEYNDHISTMQFCPGMPDGTKCMACPQEDAEEGAIVAMDGNFQLVHRRAAGTSTRKVFHPDKFFLPQLEVDAFVESHSVISRSRSQTCSNFQADSLIRTKNQTEKLDITGIFGSVCSHDFPVKFLNMRYGERMSYPLHLMTNLGKLKILMYDIGCQFEGHLNRQEIPFDFKIGVPIFHMYGHKMSCQVQYSPRCIEGAGLCDGEGTERLWSYLGRFSSISKEMTLENRHDLLVEALLFYGHKLSLKLAMSLCLRLEKAILLKHSTDKDFQDVCKLYPGTTTDKVEQWSSQEQVQRKKSSNQQEMDWTEDYALTLYEFHKKKKTVMADTDDEKSEALMAELEKLEGRLLRQERKQGIERWTEISKDYKRHLYSACDKKRLEKLHNIRECVIEYTFMERLKVKYAKGQNLAKRICQQIRTASSKIQRALADFHALPPVGSNTMPFKVERKDVMALEAPLWENLFPLNIDDAHIPRSSKRQAIETYRLNVRAAEEITISQAGMENLICSIKNRIKLIEESISDTSTEGESQVILGKIAVLRKYLNANKIELTKTEMLFGKSKVTENSTVEECMESLEEQLSTADIPVTAEGVPLETITSVIKDVRCLENEDEIEDDSDENFEAETLT